MFMRLMSIVLICSLFAAQWAQAEITPTTVPAQDVPVQVTALGNNRYKVEIWPHATATGTTVILRTSPGDSDDVIAQVIVHPPAEVARTIRVRINQIVGTLERVKDVELIQAVSPFAGSVLVDRVRLSGTLGEVRDVTQLVNAEVDGDVFGPIRVQSSETANSDVQLSSAGGDLLGDVISLSYIPTLQVEACEACRGSSITLLNFANGNIGTLSDPVRIAADLLIANISAGELHAVIERAMYLDGICPFEEYRLVQSMGNLEVGGAAGTGEFTGAIWAQQWLRDNVPFPVQWRFHGPMRAAIFLKIIGHIEPNSLFFIEHEQLKGQITSGHTAGGCIGGWWALPIQVGSVTLTPIDGFSAYSNSSQSLGGGAVGTLPYSLHRQDCFPADVDPQTIEIIAPEDIGNTIAMRHYGPVTWNVANGQPFVVSRRKAGSSDEWQPQSCFTCAPHATNDTIVNVFPTTEGVVLQRGFEYEVKLRTIGTNGPNVLRSNLPHLTTANDPEVYDYAPLIFQVCDGAITACLGDADDDGLVAYWDADSVLANWGSSACLKYGDADRDGVVSSPDLAAVELYDTFTYCHPEARGVAPEAQRPDAPAHMNLAEDSAAAVGPMTFTQAITLMGYADAEDFGEAFTELPRASRMMMRVLLMELLSGE